MMQRRPDPSRGRHEHASEETVFADADGLRLPIIDVTKPRFALPAAEIERLRQAYIRQEQRQRLVPGFVMRWMLRSAAKKSRLFEALFASKSGFLDGISTYVMKLGEDNLPPPYDAPMDKRFASSPHVTLLRLRMAQIARFLADELEGHLAASRRKLALINIGGGPAIDSLNALILLRQRNPALLDRSISIHVLDIEAAGSRFGANALAALAAKGAPLAGIEARFEHTAYDWSEPGTLERLLADLASTDALVACSSEGALFEYGSDGAIRANLRALHQGGACLVAGSVTASDDARRRMVANSGLGIVPRGLEGFAPLASEAGWTIVRTEPACLSHQVLLRPSSARA